ncbi:hypothetical protein M5689_012277 [Euphorbia peplus]|nr:hypothetical protein M5689_012277 [Euphorbia peplus]
MIDEHCHLATDESNRLLCLDNDDKLTSSAAELQMVDDQICIEPPTALEFSDKRSKGIKASCSFMIMLCDL